MADINKNSKTILQLLAGRESGKNVAEMAFPVQLGCNNYHLLVQDILNLVTKEMLGLDQVDNTADLDKPLSVLIIQALAQKAELQHNHSFNDIEGLQDQLLSFFQKNEQIPLENLDAVVNALSLYALKEHSHTVGDINGLEQILSEKANANHIHVLQELDGYQDLIAFINQQLAQILTADQVNDLIDQKLAQVDLGENIVREIPGDW